MARRLTRLTGPYRRLVVGLLNLVLGHGTESDRFWEGLNESIRKKVGRNRSDDFSRLTCQQFPLAHICLESQLALMHPPLRLLRDYAEPGALLRRFQEITGLQLSGEPPKCFVEYFQILKTIYILIILYFYMND